MGLSERDYMRNPEPGEISNFTVGLIVVTLLTIVFIVPRLNYFLYPSISSVSFQQSLEEDIVRIDPTYNRQERLARISPIDINTAPYERVILLPRISKTVATGIISGRPYFEIEQLDDVYGIGQKTVDLYRPHIAINHETLRTFFPEQFKEHMAAKTSDIESTAKH